MNNNDDYITFKDIGIVLLSLGVIAMLFGFH
jgi:hypothetical protein